MRDTNRIKPFCEALAKVWESNPDLRFGQLTSNLATYTLSKYGRDIFYIEDNELMELLYEMLNQERSKDE